MKTLKNELNILGSHLFIYCSLFNEWRSSLMGHSSEGLKENSENELLI